MPPLSAEEFEREYARRARMTVEALRATGRRVRPCDRECGYALCEGWQSVFIDDGDDWPEWSPYSVDDPRFQKRETMTELERALDKMDESIKALREDERPAALRTALEAIASAVREVSANVKIVTQSEKPQ